MKTTLGHVAALLALSLVASTSPAQEQTPAQIPAQATAATTDNSSLSTRISEAAPSPPAGTSAVRIVRLSQIKGEVFLDRNTDRGFEAAFPNLPITQNEQLKTKDGVAEVEFEDNSSLRITPDSVVEFPALQRSPSGATITTVKLLQGTLYVSLANTKGNQFNVLLGKSQIDLTPSSHIRLDAGSPTSKPSLAVLNGSAEVADSSGTITVGKKKTLTFDTAAAPVLTGKVESASFDSWDKTEADYHNVPLQTAAYGNPSYAYGINDLNYYGSFADLGGCGSLWRPYFTSAAWSPFANGIWAWYPGAGYSWVSPYPWGWTPFHYGSWQYCGAGGGWGWRPGNTWIGLANQPTTLISGRCTECPKAPLRPAPGQSTLAVSNTAPLRMSHVSPAGDFIFSKDSAGLGVPRGSFEKLNKISADVSQHGSATTHLSQPEQGSPGNRTNAASEAYRSSNRSNATSSNSSQGRPESASRSSSGGSSGGESHMSSPPPPPPPPPSSSSGGSSPASHH